MVRQNWCCRQSEVEGFCICLAARSVGRLLSEPSSRSPTILFPSSFGFGRRSPPVANHKLVVGSTGRLAVSHICLK